MKLVIGIWWLALLPHTDRSVHADTLITSAGAACGERAHGSDERANADRTIQVAAHTRARYSNCGTIYVERSADFRRRTRRPKRHHWQSLGHSLQRIHNHGWIGWQYWPRRNDRRGKSQPERTLSLAFSGFQCQHPLRANRPLLRTTCRTMFSLDAVAVNAAAGPLVTRQHRDRWGNNVLVSIAATATGTRRFLIRRSCRSWWLSRNLHPTDRPHTCRS